MRVPSRRFLLSAVLIYSAGKTLTGQYMPPPHPLALPKILALYRYPMKGMTAEPLIRVSLSPGKTIPFDRAYAIENGEGHFNPDAPRHLPKINFIMLMRHEELATLRSTFDEATHTLTIARFGAEIARGDLRTPEGRRALEDAIDAHVTENKRGRLRIVSSAEHSFSDVAPKCLHIVNLASVRALESKMATAIDPLRFRPNVVIDGLPAWLEFDLIDKTIRLGEAGLEIFRVTERCAATNVDPETGLRDLKIPSFLSKTYGHTDFGVYARVVRAGDVKVGDRIEIESDAEGAAESA